MLEKQQGRRRMTTPKNRDELISLIDGYVEGVNGSDILADIESYGLAVVPVEPTEEMAGAAVNWKRQPRMMVGHTRCQDANEAFGQYRAMLRASPFAKEGK